MFVSTSISTCGFEIQGGVKEKRDGGRKEGRKRKRKKKGKREGREKGKEKFFALAFYTN